MGAEHHSAAAAPCEQAERILAALARLAERETDGEAPGTVEVASAQIAGVSYANLGDPGLEFLEAWAEAGARVRVPSFMNPCGMDLTAWRELGIGEAFAAKQRRIIGALRRMGVTPSLTCTPYLHETSLRPGEHLAWSESSAVCCANSLYGARTNREGGPSALAAAILGRTVRSGLHRDGGRRPTHIVRVKAPLETPADAGALGLHVGRIVGSGVPYFILSSPLAEDTAPDSLKALAAALAASGAVAMFHVEGVTPEAAAAGGHLRGLPCIEVGDLAPAYAQWRGDPGPIDVVAIGCPHASLGEVRRVAQALRAKKARSRLWVMTSRAVHDRAAACGLLDALRRSGAMLLRDMCIVVAPLAELGLRRVVTDSAKTAYYLRSKGLSVGLGTLDECIEAAVSDEWRHGAPSGETDRRAGRAASAPPAAQPMVAGTVVHGRAIVSGRTRGEVLVSREPIGFFGHVDRQTGVVTEPGHRLEGRSIAGKVLAFPRAKGSTVGSYVLYALRCAGRAPAAILNDEMEPIVAAGAVIADIPAVDGISTERLADGQAVEVDGGEVRVV